ncbi:MAG TPA: ubiquinol-cytochrome c reductase iron-sulfur subunit [Ktedonobacterales bacterium]
MTDMHDSPESNEQANTSEIAPPEPANAGVSRERRARASAWRIRRIVRGQQWREEFPYHWRADDLVTRRDTLRFLVAGSGALFVATTALAAVGILRPAAGEQVVAVARVDELAEDEWRVFNYPDQYAQGILVNLPGKGLVAYSDVCTHLSCAVLYQPGDRKFHCPCHEGFFDAYTGDVLAGPPTRPLPLIELRTRDGIVYAVREVER